MNVHVYMYVHMYVILIRVRVCGTVCGTYIHVGTYDIQVYIHVYKWYNGSRYTGQCECGCEWYIQLIRINKENPNTIFT